MKRNKWFTMISASVLVFLLIFFSACSGNNNKVDSSPSASPAASETSSPTATAEPTPKPPITMSVLFNATADDFENTEVYNEIVKQTGVTMDIQLYDEQKFQVQLAGGDLPDIIQVQHVGKTYLEQLIDGGNIIPLDDLVKLHGSNIQDEIHAQGLAYSKSFWSNNTGKLYLVPIQIGTTGWGFEQTMGFTTRWDYYKELGYPAIKNIDDMVNALAAMIEKHPKTADGKKVYGAAIWNDWGTWGLTSLGLTTGNGQYNSNDGQIHNHYTEPASSSFWDTAYFLYKAQQKGILDPDAFTAKYDDIVAKATQGTLIYSAATWPFSNVNAELLKEGPDKGFVSIPLDWGFAWAGGQSIAGWADRGFAITKNAKDPERAMELINFLASEKGARLLSSGIEGVHWDMVDGKPQMKPEVVSLASTGGDEWKKTGIAGAGVGGVGAANQQGMANDTVLSDGGLVNLFNTPEMFATKQNSLHKDLTAHYGAAYPAQAYQQYETQGLVKSLKDYPQDILNAMPGMPEDIKRIVDELDQLMIKGIPEVVLKAKDDADYTKRQQALIDKLNEAGADKWFQWYKKTFEDTKAKLGN